VLYQLSYSGPLRRPFTTTSEEIPAKVTKKSKVARILIPTSTRRIIISELAGDKWPVCGVLPFPFSNPISSLLIGCDNKQQAERATKRDIIREDHNRGGGLSPLLAGELGSLYGQG
jgi:hypothetical protein